MSAFLKIDICKDCQARLSWEWIQPVALNGRSLAGTGVWRSPLLDGRCHDCASAMELRRQNEQRARALRQALLPLLGGEKPYREFTFDQYEVTSENRRAFEKALHFNCLADNLYLRGPCGVGKTHLAWAVGRACFEETLSLSILPAAQLTRKVRMKDPMQEQAIIDEWVLAKVLVLDDLGNGPDTLFTRQIVQEILDRRSFRDIGGLVVTTKFSLDQLAAKLGDDSIPSRLGGMCDVIEVQGKDRRCA